MQHQRASWDAVELPVWPLCKNAITWSSEGVAIAAGEGVHILTPRHDSETRDLSGHRQWHTFTLRTNQFDLSEWPKQPLATIKLFSVGEELSDSHVAALAWSPPGLGLYRRSVLTILTSNLLLSIWETNGKLGEWNRTCIVNHFLQGHPPPDEPSHARLEQRIRSFTWLPASEEFGTGQWSPHLLMTADDTYTISIHQVCKTTDSVPRGWSFELLARYQMPIESVTPEDIRSMSSLRTALLTTSRTTRLESTEWTLDDRDDEKSSISASLKIRVSFGALTRKRYLSVRLQSHAQMSAAITEHDHGITVTIDESQTCEPLFVNQSPTTELFESSIRGPQSDFNEEYNLNGRVLVRHWGAVYHPDRTRAAACISLHPSDMIESCLPSRQRTTVVFKILTASAAERVRSDIEVFEDILNFLSGVSMDLLRIDLDRKILANAISLVKLHFMASAHLSQWAASAHMQLNSMETREDAEYGEQSLIPGSNIGMVSADVTAPISRDVPAEDFNLAGTNGQGLREICEVCSAPITFTSAASATCTNNHYFTRCSLSFVAIQEPGISMYCAKCGKQFLDPSRIEENSGPSLSQALFNRFDICPFCQGKFRG
ncbi:hypothetical protein LTR84_000659 [Exophiala bonariae]|uniref:Transcription factor IIIC putative zinc-finger domain-containing protein n=1 Tax=Exophiala bonariae TaxID=1690606 RepID=A0AAV9NRR7_9EURO|nr:hypothetical protein LTR84_000659 [Exophiala bonariae]